MSLNNENQSFRLREKFSQNLVMNSPAKKKCRFAIAQIIRFILNLQVASVGIDIITAQEIIKVREWIPHIGPLAKVIRLKLFLDIVPSFFADITRALRGCFRGGSAYVSFRFVLKQSKASNSVKMSSLIFWLQAKELRLPVCCNTFRNFNGSLNKRRMYPAQTMAAR